MAIPNINQITSTLRMMGDTQLQQYAAMHKNDPYILPMAVAESNARKQTRAQAQARSMGQPQQKVVDASIAQMDPRASMPPQGGPPPANNQLPEEQGIAQLPTPNIQNMAGGGIVAFADGGYTDEDMMSNGEPVVRMASGGVPSFAIGGWNNARFLEYLKQNGLTAKFATGSEEEKKAIVDAFGNATSGPQKAAAPSSGPAAGQAPAPSAAPSKAFELGQKVGPTVRSVGDTLSNIGTTKTSKLPIGAGAATAGVFGAGQGLYEGYKAGDFYNDPNVSSVDKILQAGRTATRAGLPMVTAGLGSLFTPAGTIIGGIAGTGAASLIEQEGEALKAWRKANPQATPAETKKAEAAAAAATAAASASAAQTPPAPQASEAAAGADTAKAPTLSGPRASSASDVESMYSKFAGSPAERQAKLDAVRGQLGSLAGAETLAAQKQYERLQADLAARGDYGKDREAKLKTREERLGKEEGQSSGLALLEAGLAMMSGTSSNAFANIGQGAMRGTAAYRESQKRLADARDKLDDAYGRLEDVRFNQKNMDASELRQAKAGIDKAANAGIRALTDFAMKEYDVGRDEAKTMLSSFTQLRQSEIAAAPSHARNQMLANADSKLAKERKDYIALQNKTLGDLRKSTDYVTADAAKRTQMEIDAMRQALNLNPHLAQFGSNIGFTNTPTSNTVYDATTTP
jgi:hypothetical protein